MKVAVSELELGTGVLSSTFLKNIMRPVFIGLLPLLSAIVR